MGSLHDSGFLLLSCYWLKLSHQETAIHEHIWKITILFCHPGSISVNQFSLYDWHSFWLSNLRHCPIRTKCDIIPVGVPILEMSHIYCCADDRNLKMQWVMWPGRHCWGYYSGTLSCSQVSATHLEINFQLSCSDFTLIVGHQNDNTCNDHQGVMWNFRPVSWYSGRSHCISSAWSHWSGWLHTIGSHMLAIRTQATISLFSHGNSTPWKRN